MVLNILRGWPGGDVHAHQCSRATHAQFALQMGQTVQAQVSTGPGLHGAPHNQGKLCTRLLGHECSACPGCKANWACVAGPRMPSCGWARAECPRGSYLWSGGPVLVWHGTARWSRHCEPELDCGLGLRNPALNDAISNTDNTLKLGTVCNFFFKIIIHMKICIGLINF